MAKQQKSAIELIRAANSRRKIEVRFYLPVDKDIEIEVSLTAPDAYAIWELQDKTFQKALAEANQDGMNLYPVNDVDWEKELDRYAEDVRESMVKDKPKNLAEQHARKISGLRTIQELLPIFIRAADGKILFRDKGEREEFKVFLCSNPDVMNMLTSKYIDLSNRVREVQDATKNLLPPVIAENGTSETQ